MESQVKSLKPPLNPIRQWITRRRGWLLLIGAICLYGLYSWVWIPYRTERLTYHGDSSALQRTVVVPTLDSPLSRGKNTVWCASFQAAWDQLRTASSGLIKQPPMLVGAEVITNRLNRSMIPPTDLPPTSYAAAGVVQNSIVPAIRTAMHTQFPGVALPAFESLVSTDIIAYSYLEASVKFPIPYYNAAPLNFNGTRVACFGIREQDEYNQDKLRNQVRVLYNSSNEFIIDPCATSPVQIVLASLTPGPTLADTITATEKKIDEWTNGRDVAEKIARLEEKAHLTDQEITWIDSHSSFRDSVEKRVSFGYRDILLIPNMHWTIDHHFSELVKKEFVPVPLQNTYELMTALQSISFTLNRSGVSLKSIALLPAREKGEQQRFIFDHPYLLLLRQRGHSHPFFAMWVENAELLTKM